MDAARRSCRDASNLLDIATQEGVARAWIRAEANAAFNWLTVEEAELSVPDPAVLLEYSLVLAREHIAKIV